LEGGDWVKKPLIVMSIVLTVLILLFAIGIGGYFYFKAKKSQSAHPKPLTAAEAKALQIDLPENTTNLKDGLIQFTVILQADNNTTKQELTDMSPVLEDAINMTMHEYNSSQLKSTLGIKNLKSEIETKIDHLLPKGSVTGVYFSTIVVQ
jgi:flagellar basal body-associated protein FliL